MKQSEKSVLVLNHLVVFNWLKVLLITNLIMRVIKFVSLLIVLMMSFSTFAQDIKNDLMGYFKNNYQYESINYDSALISQGVVYHHFALSQHKAKTDAAETTEQVLVSPVFFTDKEQAAYVNCLAEYGVNKGELSEQEHVLNAQSNYGYKTLLVNRNTAEFKHCDLTSMPSYKLPFSGDQNIHVVEIKSDIATLQPSLVQPKQGNGKANLEQMLTNLDSVVAINGGFFTMDRKDGFEGDPSGTLLVDNVLLSEPTTSRSVLWFGDKLSQGMTILPSSEIEELAINWSDGTTLPIQGINRELGLLRNCGKFNPADTRTKVQLPKHDVTCGYDHDLVLYTSTSIVPEAQRPHLIKLGNYWLNAKGQAKAQLQHKLKTTKFESFNFAAVLQNIQQKAGIRGSINGISGAPLLLKDNQLAFRGELEGWPIQPTTSKEHNQMFHSWFSLNNPRTAIGISEQGNILLFVVDGRQPGIASGMAISELAQMLQAAGAKQALNLDGGGSSTLFIKGKLINMAPSPLRELANGINFN